MCVCAKWKWEKEDSPACGGFGRFLVGKGERKSEEGDGWEREVQSESKSWAKVFQFVYASSTQMSELLH